MPTATRSRLDFYPGRRVEIGVVVVDQTVQSKGVAAGLDRLLASGHPIVLAGDGDVGGLIGIHYREELKLQTSIVSIDGLELKEFDYIDIGAILDTSGAVPVVIVVRADKGATYRDIFRVVRQCSDAGFTRWQWRVRSKG